MDLKYPRTYHLPTSPGLQNDDRRLPDPSVFEGRVVVASEKVDGEGTTMTPDRTYPRSPDGRYHPSRDLMKAFHAARKADIPAGWRISGEYAYARHSIPYTRENGNALPAWFLGFGVWDETNALLDWDQTLEVLEMLDVAPVPTLYRGPWYDGLVDDLARTIDPARQEGFVVRVANRIPYPDGPGDQGRFFREVAKWVRRGHVQTDSHWMQGRVVPNEVVQ
jgi:hypothetical protein